MMLLRNDVAALRLIRDAHCAETGESEMRRGAYSVSSESTKGESVFCVWEESQ